MNKLKQVPAILALTALLGAGCAMTGGTESGETVQQQAERMAESVRIVTRLGVYYAVSEDNSLRPYFITSSTLIDTLVKQGDVDPKRIEEALYSLVGDDMSGQAFVVLLSAVELYSIFFKDVLASHEDSQPFALMIAQAIATGIDQGLDVPVTNAAIMTGRGR